MEADGGRISHYRVLGELGRDRLGYVLRAQDEQLDRPVVLRVVRAASVYPEEQLEEVRAGFRREAKRAARVSHPNLVTIYAFEPIDDPGSGSGAGAESESVAGVDLIVIEYVEGTSLRAMLSLGERWRVPEVARLVARIADAVAAANSAGITHGRLSLANVIIRPDGRVKVLDLGMPRSPDEGFGDDSPPAPPGPVGVDEDVRALALITLELAATASMPPGALWRPMDSAPRELAAILEDAALARRRFGILAPVILRALDPREGDAYGDAAAYRDALLALLSEPTREEAGVAETPDTSLGAGTPLLIPHGPAIPTPAGDALEDDATLPLDAEAARRPRLVLTADLAKSAGQPPPPETYVVMQATGLGARLRGARGSIGGGGRGRGVLRAKVRRGPLIAVVVALVLIAGGWIAARHFLENGGSVAMLLAQAEPLAALNPFGTSNESSAPDPGPEAIETRPPDIGGVERNAVTDTLSPAPAEGDGAADDSSPPAAPAVPTTGEAITPADRELRTAMVRANPAGTSISVDGRSGTWSNNVELDVAEGDSLIVRFTRSGYVSETRVFNGSRLAVTLRPDSVIAQFTANVLADVYLEHADGARSRIGTTDFSYRLPSGTHRFVFVATGQPEWTTEQRMPAAGQAYPVAKTDYITEGSLVVTVSSTWAWVSVDGGPPRETPVRIDGLATGTRTIHVTRDGFSPITDTVIIRPGQTATRQYTLVPRS